MCFAPQRRALFRHLNLQKWSEPLVFFNMLTSKCASRHKGVHFFDISTSKSGARLRCFVHFDFEMCFAPQGRALFDISTSKSGARLRCFVHVHFEMCFAPQRRAIFHLSSGQLAPHPPALASLLFDPPEPQIIGKTQCFATFLPFRASASAFFWLFLFSDLLSSALLFSLPLPSSAFHLSILSEVWLLNFLRLSRYNYMGQSFRLTIFQDG